MRLGHGLGWTSLNCALDYHEAVYAALMRGLCSCAILRVCTCINICRYVGASDRFSVISLSFFLHALETLSVVSCCQVRTSVTFNLALCKFAIIVTCPVRITCTYNADILVFIILYAHLNVHTKWHSTLLLQLWNLLFCWESLAFLGFIWYYKDECANI